MNLNYLIKKPVITEQSLHDVTKGVFTFEVVAEANKDQIKQAVESAFRVDVIKVRTTKTAGNRYRAGTKRIAKIGSPTKKARVQLEAGQKIDLFELDEGK